MISVIRPLPWIKPGQAFGPIANAWRQDSDTPGLLCAGADLSVDTLWRAYSSGIFPWYATGQPILWWSPDPRMVLQAANFRLHPSLKKLLKRFAHSTTCEVRVDGDFEAVISACAHSVRPGQTGTWIDSEMVQAYLEFHQAGWAHSVETRINGKLAGGLYFVAIGHAVFGESMFHQFRDASKIALAALVAMCREFNIEQIDCQQNTQHLTSLGATEISRESFIAKLSEARNQPPLYWQFLPHYWNQLMAVQEVSG